MEKTELKTTNSYGDCTLSGDDIVRIVHEIKELLMNIFDNYRQIRVSQYELECQKIKKGGR